MITLENLTIHQGPFRLSNLNMTIPTGEYGFLMGPTGSGKTTILEAICGLRRIESGKILLDGEDVSGWPASQRQIGYVPQEAVLFPTMRVEKQIEFGLEIRKIPKAVRTKRVHELAELMKITSLVSRFPYGLSGGERQRVALARALAIRPRLLCLDEPLSALDDSMRNRMTGFLRAAHQMESVTVLHITHNVAEANNLGTIRFDIEEGGLRKVEVGGRRSE